LLDFYQFLGVFFGSSSLVDETSWWESALAPGMNAQRSTNM